MSKSKISQVIINESETIEKLINKINKNKMKFCFVVNKSTMLLGIVTDGDLRRHFNNKINLKDKVAKIMNKKFISILEKDFKKYNEKYYYAKFNVSQIPILNKNGVLLDFICKYKNLIEQISSDIPVFILAGGLGTRLKPITDKIPKPMVKVANKPMLELLINKLELSNLRNIHISTFYKSNLIKNYFSNGKKFNVDIKYTIEKKLLGTAGPLNYLKKLKNKDTLIINSDVFTNLSLSSFITSHQKTKSDISILSIKKQIYVDYGTIIKKSGKIIISEKPHLPVNIMGGIYIIKNSIIKKLLKSNEYLNMDELIRRAYGYKYKINIYKKECFWSDMGTFSEINNVENFILNK